MTRILVVDDDNSQVRALTRVITAHGEHLQVVTAVDGVEAVEVLRAMAVDLVLTDLQMPRMDGYELFAWLMSNQPHVLFFAMTAYLDGECAERLQELGNVEYFSKPIDTTRLLGRLTSVLSESVRGHVRNISLAAFLQLIEMERKTCTLTVQSEMQTGYLYVHEGMLIDARSADREGEAAALEIICWSAPSITITGHCGTNRQTVESSMSFIIMEAMRLKDEADWEAEVAASLRNPTNIDDLIERDDELDDDFGDEGMRRSVSEFPARLPGDAEAIAVVELATGRVRTSAGTFDRLDAVAELVAKMFAAEVAAVAQLDIEEEIDELVITSRAYWAVVRPLSPDANNLALLIFDPDRANLVMERIELAGFLAALSAWSPYGR